MEFSKFWMWLFAATKIFFPGLNGGTWSGQLQGFRQCQHVVEWVWTNCQFIEFDVFVQGIHFFVPMKFVVACLQASFCLTGQHLPWSTCMLIFALPQIDIDPDKNQFLLETHLPTLVWKGLCQLGGWYALTNQICWIIGYCLWQEWGRPKRTSFQLGNCYICITQSKNVFKLTKFAVCGHRLFFADVGLRDHIEGIPDVRKAGHMGIPMHTKIKKLFQQIHWDMNQSDSFLTASGRGW